MNFSRTYWWIAVRGALIIAGLVQSKSMVASLGQEFRESSWSFPLEMTAICAFAILFLIGIQAKRVRQSEEKWQRPSWFRNPFNYRQPLQFFDAISYYAFALAVGCAIFGLSESPISWAWELPFSVGLGLWIGVRLSLIAFKESLESPAGSRADSRS
jgi:uncharacterized membrane protein (DUF4010 family)